MKKTQVFTGFIHVIGWLLFLRFPVLFIVQSNLKEYVSISVSIGAFCLYYMAFFYLNTLQLIPKLYLRKKQLLYFLVIAILLITTVLVKPFDRLIASNRQSGVPPPMDRKFRSFEEIHRDSPLLSDEPGRRVPRAPRMIFDIVSIVLFLLVWAVGYALQLVTLWKNTEMRVAQAEAERSRAELSFLKARINPHFLFNTLNNIYSMALINHEETATSVMKLSQIMRYITDDIENDFVLLENELQCVDNYISLQRLRLNKNTALNYVVNGNPVGKMIAPLILMPFIENIFKYGVSNHKTSPIDIRLDITQYSVYFHTHNRIVSTSSFDIERSGIGIENTKKRLELLYPNRHLLLINSMDESFTVELTIYFEGTDKF